MEGTGRIAGAAISPFALEFDPVCQKIRKLADYVDAAVQAARFDGNHTRILLWQR